MKKPVLQYHRNWIILRNVDRIIVSKVGFLVNTPVKYRYGYGMPEMVNKALRRLTLFMFWFRIFLDG